MKKLLRLLVLLAGALVAIQFIPYGKDHTNPKVVSEPRWDSPNTRATFMKLCGDCHSHETVWPAYSNYAPISWLVTFDVNNGRRHFNVSLWEVQERNKGGDAAGEYKDGDMPPWIYTLPRPENRLEPNEREAFINGLKATFEAK